MILALFYILFVLLPIIFWLGFFSWEERSDPEPKKLLLKIFFLGIGVAILAAAIEASIGLSLFPGEYKKTLIKNLINADNKLTLAKLTIFGLAGIVEEILKYLTLKEFVYNKTEFNQIADGLFYAVTLALGFSFIENTDYFYTLYKSATFSGFIIGALLRGVMTTMLHITAAGIMGYSMGKMKFSLSHSKKIIFTGLLLAIFLHSVYNIVILFPFGIFVAFPLIFCAFTYLIILLNRPETKTVWRLISIPQNKEQTTG